MQTAYVAGTASTARVESLRGGDAATALKGVADEFEALFVDIMLKAARKSESGNGLFDSHAVSTYREMLDQQLALTLAQQHDLGIGTALESQFGAMLGVTPPATASSEVSGALPGVPMTTATRRPPAPTGAPLAGSHAAFVERLRPHAEQAAAELGVRADALIAQAALETGWGEHQIRHADGRSAHNYFGIKAGGDWSGETVRVRTTEYVDGRAVSVDADFRAYPDAATAFTDYVSLISGNARYRGALAAGHDTAGFARGLAAGGYATDPDYASKIARIAGGLLTEM